MSCRATSERMKRLNADPKWRRQATEAMLATKRKNKVCQLAIHEYEGRCGIPEELSRRWDATMRRFLG